MCSKASSLVALVPIALSIPIDTHCASRRKSMLKSMLARLRETQMREFEGEEAAEAGFTLIELMVVLLIIAILLAIAIPTFLGVTGSANDRAAQSNLTNGLTEAKALYQNQQSYAAAVLPIASSQASAPEFGG